MLSLVAFVFLTAFLVVFLLLYLATAGSPRDSEQTLARLNALAVAAPEVREPETIDILREDVLSDIPWVNEFLHAFNLFPSMRRILRQANVDWRISVLGLFSGLLWLIGGILAYMRTGAWFLSFALGALLATIPWMLVLHKRKKRFAEFEEKLPEALDLMVSALRGGHGFTSSMGLACKEISEPVAGEFRQCFDEQNFGLDLRLAMNNLADRVPIPDVQLIVSAVLIQKDTGGNLAEVLEKVAYIIRERFRLKRQVRVHTAQGRMTGWVLSVMPVVLGFAALSFRSGAHGHAVASSSWLKAAMGCGLYGSGRSIDYQEDRSNRHLKRTYADRLSNFPGGLPDRGQWRASFLLP